MYHYRRGRFGRELRVPDREHAALLASVIKPLVRLLPAHPAAHGYVRGRCPETALLPHVGCRQILSLDLVQFFPSIDRDMVWGGLTHLGIGDVEKSVILDLCMHEGRLPVGACTSPALSNIACWCLDLALTTLGHTYTRYSDQLLLSGRVVDEGAARRTVRFAGFRVNERKSRLLTRGRTPMVVMGVRIAESGLSIPRGTRRAERALRHRLGLDV